MGKSLQDSKYMNLEHHSYSTLTLSLTLSLDTHSALREWRDIQWKGEGDLL